MHLFHLKSINLIDLKGSVLYKTTGGYTKNAALLALTDGTIMLKIPRILGTTALVIRIFRDGESSGTIYVGKWVRSECDNDIYEIQLNLLKDLYFYKAELNTPFGKIYAFREGEYISFSYEQEGNAFQLTVFDFAYDSLDDFLGGIIYHVFVDRFARCGEPKAKKGTIIADYTNGIPEYPRYPGAELKNNTFYGGSLYGVIDKLDYIKSLGASIIYLSPIFESPSNHKYDTSDYMRVDEAFGGDEALAALIEKAHAKGIKIILDGVFNHTGADSIYFNRYSSYESVGAYQSKESPYYHWYSFEEYPRKYTCWWDIEILPRINTRNPDCETFFVGKHGVIEKYASMGIDGFRLDVADELSDRFIAKIKKTLADSKKGSILYGEVWEDASNKIAYSERKQYYLGEELDGVMNYPLRRGIIDYLVKKSTDNLKYALTEVMVNAPERIMHLQMNLLGTHDTERILTVLGGESADGRSNDELSIKRMSREERVVAKRRLKAAYTILATLPGIPTIFYGDEAGLEGYSDPFNRMPYPWGSEDKEILDFYKKIGIIRKDSNLLRRAPLNLHELTKDLLLFSRTDGKNAIITAVNNSPEPIKLGFSNITTDVISDNIGRSFVLYGETAAIFETITNTTLTFEMKERDV